MRARALLVAVGTVLIAYGMIGALTDNEADPIGMAVFLVAVLIGHDLLWMPALLAVAVLIGRAGAGVRVAALVAVSVAVVALPLVLGFGRPPDNPSVLPLRYGPNLALIVLVIALTPAVSALIRKKLARPRRRGSG
jgi:hypothetical protein